MRKSWCEQSFRSLPRGGLRYLSVALLRSVADDEQLCYGKMQTDYLTRPLLHPPPVRHESLEVEQEAIRRRRKAQEGRPTGQKNENLERRRKAEGRDHAVALKLRINSQN